MPTKLSVEEALVEADELNGAIHKAIFVRELPGDLRSIFSLACLDVAMGHFIAIRFLTSQRNDVDSSIRALYRPLLETCYRAAWLYFVAPDVEIEAFGRDKDWEEWPKVSAIAAKLDLGHNTKFFSLNAGDILLAHDFTHCGREAILRHYDDVRGLGPSRNDLEVATLVLRSVIVLGVVAGMFAEKVGNPDGARHISGIALRRVTEDDATP